MHRYNAKLGFKSNMLAVLLIFGVLAIAPALGWRATAVSTVRTKSSALTQPATIPQKEPTPPLTPTAGGALQGDQDLLQQTRDRLAERRVVGPQMFDLDMGSDPDEPLDPDRGWLMKREVFEQLSSAGQRAVLISNGHGGHSSGGRGQRGTFGQNLRVNDPAQDLFGVTQSESSITARGRNIVVAFNDFGGFDSSSGYAFSTDNGKTFKHQRLPAPPGGGNFGDPVVAFGPQGELYYSNISGDAAGRFFIGVAKSIDGGATFSFPVNASTTLTSAANFQDKPWMTVDTRPGSPFLGNVYVSWTSVTPFSVFIAFARSTDGGQSFSAPIHITPPTNAFYIQGSVPAVAPNGEIYVAFVNGVAGGISVAKSTDGGQTFGPPVTAAAPLPNMSAFTFTGGGGVRTNNFPGMAIDSRGNVHIVFEALPDLFNLFALDRSDIFYIRSEDGGNNFTQPVQMNDDATNTTQFLPSVAVSDEGSVAVKWWDRRNDTNHDGLTDVYMTISGDGGHTFSKNFRITDTNWVFGPVEGDLVTGGYHGDYDAMAGGPNRFLLSWSDERNADPDVFFSDQQAQRNHDNPDFNLSALKLFDGVIAGNSVNFPFSTNGSSHGFSGNLKLSASPAINGISYNFSDAQIKPGQPASLTVLTDASVASDTYLITVTAAGNGSSRSTSFRLTVFPPSRIAGVPVNATDTPGFTDTISGLQVDSSGILHLAYSDDTQVPDIGDQVFYEQSHDDGATFSTPVLISTNSPLGVNTSLAVDSAGNPYLIWTGLNASFTAQQIFLSRSTNGGASFSSPIAISPPWQAADLASIAVDHSGKIMVIYQDFATPSLQLFMVRSTNGGATFSAPMPISPAVDGVNPSSPARVAFDSLGAAYVVYGSSSARVRLLIAPNGVNFTVFKTVSNPAVRAFTPHIAVAPGDNIFVTFSNRFAVPGGANFDVMLTKSGNHGTTFSALSNISNNSGQSVFPFVIPDGLGRVTVTWHDTTANSQSDIFVAHSSNGGLSFSVPFNLSGNSGFSLLPCGAVNSMGKVFVGWTDDSPANRDILVAAIPF